MILRKYVGSDDMIGIYLNDSVLHKKRTGNDDTNSPQYAEAVSIDTNKQSSNRFIRKSSEEQVVAKNLYVTEDEVFIGDLIDGNLVLDVRPDKFLDGTIVGYEVYT